MRGLRAVLPLALSCVTALSLASCGASHPGTPPSKWAQQFCGGFEGWYQQASGLSSSYRSELGAQTDPATIKKDTLDYLKQQSTLVDNLITSLRKAGSPAVPDGTKIYDALIAAVENYRSVIDAGQTALSAVSTSNTQSVHDAIDTVAADIDNASPAMGKQIASIGKKYSTSADAALIHALDTNQSCKKFVAQG